MRPSYFLKMKVICKANFYNPKKKVLILKTYFIKNLQNYGVQEINAKEVNETTGGFLWFAAAAIGIGIALVIRGIIRRNQ